MVSYFEKAWAMGRAGPGWAGLVLAHPIRSPGVSRRRISSVHWLERNVPHRLFQRNLCWSRLEGVSCWMFIAEEHFTSRCSCLRSFQVLICLGWSGKVPLILVLQTRFFREKRKKNLAWSSRGKESCLKGKTKKNLFRITRYSISLERQAWFFPQKRKKILARSSSWTSRAVFVHERLYIRASLLHLFIWTRRQRTVSASNMTKILFPFFAGAACWSRVSRCIRWKVYLSRLNQQGMYF